MKTVKILMMTAFCLSLAGCGLSDPWKQWENEGTFSDRLLPSEALDALCSAEGWKLTYGDTDFYFQFSDDGTVVCSSTFFYEAATTSYHLNWDDPLEVMVVITGSGHFSYLSNNAFVDTIVITSITDEGMTCRPGSGEGEYHMLPVSASDIEAMEADKWEIRTVLLSASGWKFSYQDFDFYFCFSEDGSVWCNSLMPKAAVTTTYSFSGSTSSPVLTISGGGHLSYLSDEYYEDTFAVESCTDGCIGLRGATTGVELSLVAVSESEISEIEIQKGAIFKVMEANLMNGVIKKTDGTFLAHYVIDSELGSNIRFDILEDGTLTHQSVSFSIDDAARITFDSPVSISGNSVTGIAFDLNTESGTVTGGSGMLLSANYSSRDYFVNDYETYILYPKGGASAAIWNEITGNASVWSQIEINDRDNRPLIFVPVDFGSRWYVAIYGCTDISSACSDTENDLVYLTSIRGDMILGGDSANITEILSLYPVFLDAWSHEDGLYVICEEVGGSKYIYFLSPTTDTWIKGAK